MLFDYHAHTPRCGHADGPMEAYVERAIALGMGEFGFSEHSPWMIQDPGQWNCLRWNEVDAYIADVRRMQATYDQAGGDRPFRVKLGLEADFLPSRLAVARDFFAKYPFDYIIGSVHHLGFWCLPKSSEAEEYSRHHAADVCELYFEVVGQLIRARFCDVIAHIDLPKKFGIHPPDGFLPYIEPLLPDLKQSGIAVEINASGYDHSAGEAYPGWDVVEALNAAGIPLLVNSDSHKPAHVGRHFPQVLDRLSKIGVKTLTRFEARQPIAAPLPASSLLVDGGLR